MFTTDLPDHHYWVAFEQDGTDWYSLSRASGAVLQAGYTGLGLTWSSPSSSPSVATGDFSYDCLGSWSLCKHGVTISLWLRPTLHHGNYAYFGLGDQLYRVDVLYYNSHQNLAGTNRDWVIITSNGDKFAIPFGLQLTQWSQVVITLDLSEWELKVWVNGNLANTLMIQQAALPLPGSYKARAKLTYGQAEGIDKQILTGFAGSVDECHIYNRPFTDDEVLQFYCKHYAILQSIYILQH